MSGSICITVAFFEVYKNMLDIVKATEYLEKTACSNRSRNLVHLSQVFPL